MPKPFCHDCVHFGVSQAATAQRSCRQGHDQRWLAPTTSTGLAYGLQPVKPACFMPMNITQEQLDRGLTLAENVVGLVSDVWQHRKAAKAKKVRLPVTRKADRVKRLTKGAK